MKKISGRDYIVDKKIKWNRKYEERLNELKELTVNGRLKELSPYLMGGHALDLACGLGGNSLYLAEHNYNVQAFDISDVAIKFLNTQAEGMKVPIQAHICDLTDLKNLRITKESKDLVIITYYLDRALFPLIKFIIKKHGYFFMETFYSSQNAEYTHVSNKYKLQPQELIKQFIDWKILYYEENKQVGRQTIFCQKP